jgi:hypothetical protein
MAGVLGRSTPALACIAGAFLIAAWFAVGRGHADEKRWALPMVVAGLVPFSVYCVINLLKFGSLMSDPLSQQVWTELNAHRRAFLASSGGRGFALHLLPTGLWTYLQPFGLRVEPTFPFLMLPVGVPVGIGGVTVDLTYPTASLPASMPLLFLLTCGALYASFRRRASGALRRMRIPLLVGVGAAFIDFFLGYYAPRFLGDFLPLLVLGGAIGMAEVWRGEHSRLVRRVLVGVLAILGLFSMAVNVGLAVSPTTEWTTTQTSNYIKTVKSISDDTGHPLDRDIKHGFPLPHWAPAGEIFVVGNCAGLYISSGDRFDTVPLLQAQHKTWVPVEVAPQTNQTLGVAFHAKSSHLGAGVPILSVGPDTVLVRDAGGGRAQFVLEGSRQVDAGPAFKPKLGHIYLFDLETNPTTREVIISNGPGLVAYVSGVLSRGSPGTRIEVRTPPHTSSVSSAVLGAVNPVTRPPDTSLCRSLVKRRPPTTEGHGYWLVGSDGGIFTFGSAGFYGSTGDIVLQRPVVGITPTANDGGYWLVAADGGVFSFGDAAFLGSIPGLGLAPAGSGKPHALNAPIVGIVPSDDGSGYFMVGSDGGVFAFGDARFAGSCPGIGGCAGGAIAVVPDASGKGYWLVTGTGHVYAFGDAPYLGAPGPQGSPITSMVRTPSGFGYWILDANGQVFPYGDAANLGSVAVGTTGGLDPATTIFATSDGGGYWVSSALGAVHNFGDAPNDGGMAGRHLNGPIIAGSGY